jgi:hypothetical protein
MRIAVSDSGHDPFHEDYRQQLLEICTRMPHR